MRFAEEDAQPEVDTSLTHSWRRGSLSLFYGRTLAFAPVRGDASSLSQVHRAGLSLGFQGPRWRVGVSPTYYRNKAETFESETWRGSLDAVYMLKRWLGLGGGYSYTFQRNLSEPHNEAERHLARIGLTIAPWNLKDPQGLR
jgi:hypothetical protein